VPVYIGEDTPEEPDFQYIPDTHHSTLPPGGDPLSGSMLLLQEGLESGTLLAQFEVGFFRCVSYPECTGSTNSYDKQCVRHARKLYITS